MDWKKVSPKLIKSLVHGKQYLLAFQWGNGGWSYQVDTWYKWSKNKPGHFQLFTMPTKIAEIEEPEAK